MILQVPMPPITAPEHYVIMLWLSIIVILLLGYIAIAQWNEKKRKKNQEESAISEMLKFLKKYVQQNSFIIININDRLVQLESWHERYHPSDRSVKPINIPDDFGVET